MPRYGDDRHLRMIETWIVPAQRLRRTHRGEEAGVLLVRDLVSGKLEGIHPDAMHWLFIVAPDFAAHPEPALWDMRHHRFDGFEPGRWRGCHGLSIHTITRITGSSESLFSQARQPRIQDGQAPWLDRDEGDSHPRSGPRISHFPYRNAVHASMRNCQSDLRALREWSHCLHKAPQQVQVLGMCHNVLFGLQVDEIDAGHERMTGRAMTLGVNRGTTSAWSDCIPIRTWRPL